MKKILLFAATVLLFACSKEVKLKNQSVDLDVTGEIQQVNTQTVIQDPENPNNFISSIDSIIKYGFGYKVIIPDTLKGHDLKIVYSGSMKETESLTGELVLSVHEQNMNTLFWSTYSSIKIVKEFGKWTSFKDSAIIFADKNPKNAMFLFLFNQKLTGNGLYLIDNLKVKIYKN